jgi:hypothetical protein
MGQNIEEHHYVEAYAEVTEDEIRGFVIKTIIDKLNYQRSHTPAWAHLPAFTAMSVTRIGYRHDVRTTDPVSGSGVAAWANVKRNF